MTLDRCGWATGGDPLYISYHDNEWGVPVHDDQTLFEFLVLEGAQAGLSWSTILRRRGEYRKAFDGFDPEKVARYDSGKVKALMSNSGIIRNRSKVRSAVTNARALLGVQDGHGTFDRLVWSFVQGSTKVNRWKSLSEVPAKTTESIAMSKALSKLGFSFVGPTICYAFMQATGMVNDHLVSCFRYKQVMK